MVSYKKMYEELKERIKQENEPVLSDYLCPLCGSECIQDSHEFYCKNEDCKFDKTFGDLLYFYADTQDLSRRE